MKATLEIRDDAVTDPPAKIGDEKEIVANDAYFHLERMSDECVWIGLQVGKRFVHINLYAVNRNLIGMSVEEE
jgi:hypothetical protein